MVQRPSNPWSATQGEVAKRGSVSGRLLQTVPGKGNCSDIKKKNSDISGDGGTTLQLFQKTNEL